jgi:phosphoribosylformimino-5-aminoimidazole carboxamide ribotide isomerase
MIVIPAVDIKDGRCVRLLQGRMDAETVFSDDPLEMARRWADQGAELIHVVDLDGAIKKGPRNPAAIEKIVRDIRVPVQVGGGIRDIQTVRMYLDSGAAKVVIGSGAISHPEMVLAACREFPERIVLGIDARNGMVAIEGWTETTDVSAIDLAKRFEGIGLSAINFTDIARDGMRTGPNIPAIRDFARAVAIPVVASGGVSAIGDIKALAEIPHPGIKGVIIGRALYEGDLNLPEAIAVAAEQRA